MPELVESIEEINEKLKRDFGKENNSPRWRVVWANDQVEKRWMTHTDEGFELINPEVREVRKYQNVTDRYVLERLTPIKPPTDLVSLMSYEPVWVFRDRHENYLPPQIWACKLIIDTVMENMHRGASHKKYFDPKATEEERQKTIMDMEETLFGNETPVGDALAHKYGVTVPGPASGDNSPKEVANG